MTIGRSSQPHYWLPFRPLQVRVPSNFNDVGCKGWRRGLDSNLRRRTPSYVRLRHCTEVRVLFWAPQFSTGSYGALRVPVPQTVPNSTLAPRRGLEPLKFYRVVRAATVVSREGIEPLNSERSRGGTRGFEPLNATPPCDNRRSSAMAEREGFEPLLAPLSATWSYSNCRRPA